MRWLGLAALALGAVSCSSSITTLTVPVSRWPGYEFFPLAHELGLDRRHGLSLNLKTYANPQDIVHAYLRGDLQLAQLTTVEAVDLCNRVPKRCPVVVLVLDESRGGDQVVVKRSLDSIAQLRSLPVAITPSTLGPFVLSRALARHDLTLDDVELSPMPLEAMPDALVRGDVAAAAMFPPFSDQAIATGKVRPLFTSREIPGEIFDILVVDPDFLASRRRDLVRLLRVWQDAHNEADERPHPAIAIMARHEGVTEKAFRDSLKGLVFLSLTEQQPLFAPDGILERNLRILREVQAYLNLLPADAPLPPIDNSIIQEALSSEV
ncbi:ABC transporter substrate-binding protein [Synechococcus sp. CCY9202]|uniref:ABC transporter substrate-binding protein n=1 Tax=Synechococcus sp. CCY9202 TaxID=174698 RepID=UPI002B20FEB7|nr:ABC transporter substrate-binding protein [Synechococcus sp. CCY9202]MEA5424913.1 ABC transporter substrate-binding protein [Synechococcus sp. CCY9202]